MTLLELVKDLNELKKIQSKDRITITINGNPIFQTTYNNQTERRTFMIVKVTQEHIDKARQLITEAKTRGDDKQVSLNCPITLALKETFKVNFAEVNLRTFTIGQFPENLVFEKPIPEYIWNWVRRFDKNVAVEPFEFELSLEGVKL